MGNQPNNQATYLVMNMNLASGDAPLAPSEVNLVRTNTETMLQFYGPPLGLIPVVRLQGMPLEETIQVLVRHHRNVDISNVYYVIVDAEEQVASAMEHLARLMNLARMREQHRLLNAPRQ